MADTEKTSGQTAQEKSSAYQAEFTVRAADVDRFQHLRMSSLFQILQEISIAHTEELGYPKETTLDRGYLWVISRVRVRLSRPIRYDERLTIESWPEPMLHMVYPRGYRFLDAAGTPVAEATALWILIDQKTRRIALPQATGVDIPGDQNEKRTIDLPEGLSGGFDALVEKTHHVTFSEIDLNGHVNNTRYLDWIDDLFGMELHKEGLFREIQMNFEKEIPVDADVRIRFRKDDAEVRIEGVLSDGTEAFEARGVFFDADSAGTTADPAASVKATAENSGRKESI